MTSTEGLPVSKGPMKSKTEMLQKSKIPPKNQNSLQEKMEGIDVDQTSGSTLGGAHQQVGYTFKIGVSQIEFFLKKVRK